MPSSSWKARGSSSADFERVVGWATIFSLILAFGGLALAVWGPRAKAMRSSTQVADALSAQVLKDEGLALSELLYVGQDPGRAANLAFHQDVLLGADRVQGQAEGCLDLLPDAPDWENGCSRDPWVGKDGPAAVADLSSLATTKGSRRLVASCGAGPDAFRPCRLGRLCSA